MQEGTRHLLKLKSTGDCPRTNNGAHLIEMPDEIEISKGRLPWCVQCGLEFSKTEAELMAIIFARAALIAAIEAIELNPLATTPRQHVEFTKRDAVDAVKRWIGEKE